MKKWLILFLVFFGTVSISYAIPTSVANISTVSEDVAGTYVNRGTVVDQLNYVGLSHNHYYTWGVNDIDSNETPSFVDIVFSGIYDDTNAENILNLYIYDISDITTPLGFDRIARDNGDVTIPDWESEYGATFIGSWEYDHSAYDQPTDKFDVVFTITNTDLIEYMMNGNAFGIGMDPECSFITSSIKVVAPVPEPATMILFGMGLLGLAGITRKKIEV